MGLTYRDIPPFPDYVEGETDHEYMAKSRGVGPLVKDRLGIVSAFSLADMLEFNDDRWTRQIELEGMFASGVSGGPMFDFVSNVLLFANGAIHTNRRTPLTRTFAHPVVAALRPEIRRRADALIKPLVGTGQIEFVDAIASPLPAKIIASIVGAPEDDAERFGAYVYSAIRGLSLVSEQVRAESDRDMAALTDYVGGLLEDRRQTPQEDFMTSYLEKVADGPLDDTEIRAQMVGLVLAGSDTTRGALTATVSQLMQHPDQWALLVSDPDTHAPGAVSEGLRFDPVIGSLARITTRDVHGYRLPASTFVSGSMLTALRDPEVYANPDQFDITRQDHPRWHPVFGGGPHRCLGEALARIELEEALKALATHAPDMQLIGPPTRLRGYGAVRTLTPMTVSI